MKNIIKIIFATLILVAFASCEKTPQNGGDDNGEDNKVETPALNENIKFTLEVTTVDITSATIKVSHDGTSADTWYAFATTETNINKALTNKITEITASGDVKGLKKQTNYSQTVSGLNPDTDYTFIVFGITSKGITYGKHATIQFKTLPEKVEVTMKENSAWTVEYNGADVIYEQEYDHTITVKSTDKNKYFITTYPKEIVDKYDLKLVAEDALLQLKDVVAYFNQNGYPNLTLADMLFEGSGIDAAELSAGEWYAFAFGVEGEDLSGLYAISDVITIEEEEPTAEYSAWIGDWTFTGANNVAFDVTISKDINNVTYLLSGWESYEASEDCEIPMIWSPEDNMWIIAANNFGSFEFGNYGQGDIWICGALMSSGGIFPQQDLPICYSSTTDEGNKVCVAVPLKDGEGNEFSCETMMYIIDWGSPKEGSRYWMYSDLEVWPTFPITITPRENTTPAAVKTSVAEEIKGTPKFTKLPKPIKTFYQSYKMSSLL